MRRITSLSISTPKANAICWAMRGQPQLRLRRFMATTASMSSCFGPCGPGRRLRLGVNNKQYFRFFSALWRYTRVEVFRTMAERRTRVGRMKRVHKPALKAMQRWHLEYVLPSFPVHAAAMAYRKKTSIFDNASVHAGSKYLLRMDFQNCFPSIVESDLKSYIDARPARF